jgi:hypothetical protein
MELSETRPFAVRASAPASPWLPVRRFFTSGVAMGLTTAAGLTLWILLDLGGWKYYGTPLGVRGYAPMHPALRPSGPFGQSFGVFGAAMMLVPFLYMIRKRVHWKWAGSLKVWLEVHLFCGIVGPTLVTFHTTFKFNGIVSAAYWSMMLVMLSGFVGRYLYVRIPKTLRGTELTRAELDERASTLLADLSDTVGHGPWLERVRAIEAAAVPAADGRLSFIGLLFGEFVVRWRIRSIARDLHRSHLPADRRQALVHLVTERTLLLRRIAYLKKTKQAFGLWHVFHVPLVYLMLIIVTVHVAVALYLGYIPFRW